MKPHEHKCKHLFLYCANGRTLNRSSPHSKNTTNLSRLFWNGSHNFNLNSNFPGSVSATEWNTETKIGIYFSESASDGQTKGRLPEPCKRRLGRGLPWGSFLYQPAWRQQGHVWQGSSVAARLQWNITVNSPLRSAPLTSHPGQVCPQGS